MGSDFFSSPELHLGFQPELLIALCVNMGFTLGGAYVFTFLVICYSPHTIHVGELFIPWFISGSILNSDFQFLLVMTCSYLRCVYMWNFNLHIIYGQWTTFRQLSQPSNPVHGRFVVASAYAYGQPITVEIQFMVS